MKKDLLFVIPSLMAGGAQKSLINLLSQINFNLYTVDLLLFTKEGLFLNSVPNEVRIIEANKDFKVFTTALNEVINPLIKSKKYKLLYNRILFSINNRLIKDVTKAEQTAWKYYKNTIPTLKKRYDAAIGFLEKTPIYFIVDKVEASKKIGWIHSDYNKLGMNAAFDQQYFEGLDYIVTVSDECGNVLKDVFPTEMEKVKVIQNIVSPSLIKRLSAQSCEIDNNKNQEYTFLSIGRLYKEKGFDIAITATEKLVREGYKIKWFIIGAGEEEVALQSMIKEKDLSESFILLGLKENPYPYIKNVDIYIQPSRYEGKAIAIDEAKILCKPIVVTNFTTAKDQIIHEENGLIVDMTADALSEGIKRIIHNEEMKNQFMNRLQDEKLNTENEIDKIYALIE